MITSALAVICVLLLVTTLMLLAANRSFSKAWQQEQAARAIKPSPVAVPASSAVPEGASNAEARLFFPEHRSRGAGRAAALSLAASPARLVELQFETPAGLPATKRWTITIAGSAGEILRQSGLPVQNVGGISWVRSYVDTGSLLLGSYRVVLSREEAPNSGAAGQWSFTVTR